VRVAFTDGSSAFYETKRQPRPDVQRFLKNMDMPDPGYEAEIDLQGKSAASLAIVGKTASLAVVCDNLTVAAGP
jgi:hypothetical protein